MFPILNKCLTCSNRPSTVGSNGGAWSLRTGPELAASSGLPLLFVFKVPPSTCMSRPGKLIMM